MKKWQIAIIAAITIFVIFLMDGGSVYVKQLLNRPPKAAFTYRTPTRTLKYIAPTDRDLIMFLNNSTDPDGDPLTSQWFIRYNGTGDWKLLNSSTHHWGRLPVSNEKGHETKLVVSDGMKDDSAVVVMPVDRTDVFETITYRIPKGMCYTIGVSAFGDYYTPPKDDEILEDLSEIYHELGCRNIRLFGDNEDKMLTGATIAANIGFNTIMLSPSYVDSTQSEVLAKLDQFSRKAETLRSSSTSRFILLVANEAPMDIRGFVEGKSRQERVDNYNRRTSNQTAVKKINRNVNAFLGQLVSLTRSNFKGEISYSSIADEDIDWIGLGFDVVCQNRYLLNDRNSEAYSYWLERLKIQGKPTCLSEFGCRATEGELRQALIIEESLGLIEQNSIGMCFLWNFKRYGPISTGSYEITRFNGKDRMFTRTLAWYKYRSFTNN